MENINLEKINNTDYEIISLGLNCLPRVILTRWGLKKTKDKGELSMPFDLAVFETFEVAKNLADDFEFFFENLQYTKEKKLFGKSYWAKYPDLIKFIHEKSFKKSDKYKLLDMYNNRIKNFKDAIKKESPILFLQIIGDAQDVNKTYVELLKLRGSKPFKLVVIDTQNIVKDCYPEINVLKLPYPNKSYQKTWWKRKNYNSKQGIEFERQIIDFCIDKIEEFKR